MSQAVAILMPSEMMSRPHECENDEAIKLAGSYTRQMRAWPNFEAWVLLLEDGKEISREHIKT